MDVNQWYKAKKDKRNIALSLVFYCGMVIVIIGWAIIPRYLARQKDLRAESHMVQDTPILVKEWYDYYNQYDFSGKLPSNTEIKCSNDFSEDGISSADTRKNGQKFIITFYRYQCTDQSYIEATLLHEMVHIELWGHENPYHGDNFQKEISRLSPEFVKVFLWNNEHQPRIWHR